MKKIILTLNLILVLGLVGCSGEKEDTRADDVKLEQEAEKTEVNKEETTENKETETEELTERDLSAIVYNAMNNTEDYQAKRVLTHWVYVHNREHSGFDKDYTLTTDILFDYEKQASYCKGSWENLVIDYWTGTTSSGEVEEYYFPDEQSGEFVYIYETGVEDAEYGESARDYNSIATYYEDCSGYELVEETETEYVIRSYLEYITILEIVGEYSINIDEKFPVTFTIDKETNQIHHIHWKFEYVDTSDLIVEMNMEITPMEEVTVERP